MMGALNYTQITQSIIILVHDSVYKAAGIISHQNELKMLINSWRLYFKSLKLKTVWFCKGTEFQYLHGKVEQKLTNHETVKIFDYDSLIIVVFGEQKMQSRLCDTKDLLLKHSWCYPFHYKGRNKSTLIDQFLDLYWLIA